MRAWNWAAAALALTGTAGNAATDAPVPYSLNGMTGLVDMPNARMQPDGEVALTFGRFGNTTRTTIMFQAAPWAQIGLTTSSIDDITPVTGGGLRGTDDRAFNVKFRLLEEEGWRPSISIGMSDILGNGSYSAEYVVATKEVLPGVTVTGGMGWGRLSGTSNLTNPFGTGRTRNGFDPSDTRGKFRPGSWFAGDHVGFFGGFAWETPVKGVTLKAEYSSDDYALETGQGAFDRKSPLNFGLEYKPFGGVAIGAYYMYGSEFGLRVTFSGNPHRPVLPQNGPPGPIPVSTRAADSPRDGSWASDPAMRDKVATALAEALAGEGLFLEQAALDATSVEIRIENTRIGSQAKALGRSTRILAAALPASIQTFRVTLVESGVPTTTAVIDRSHFESQIDRPDAIERSFAATSLVDAGPLAAAPLAVQQQRPRFSWSVSPRIPLSLFYVDSPVNYDVQIAADASYRLAPGLTVNASIAQSVLSDVSGLQRASDSNISHNRSDFALYVHQDRPVLDRLSVDYLFKPVPEVYGRVSAGYLERMYAGVSGELLWKPAASPVAVGVEVNAVRQRDYDEPFAFLTEASIDGLGTSAVADRSLYQTDVITSGHASIYWQTGWHGVDAQLDAGRYLAGDWGATLMLSRTFANGWRVGAYATVTDKTGDERGKTNVDNGIQISVPLRWTAPYETRKNLEVDLRESARDAGSRVEVENRLYPMLRGNGRDALERSWSTYWQ